MPNCANKCKANCHTIQYSKCCLSQVLFELSPDTKIHGFVSALIFGRNATASPVEDGPFEDVFPISYWKREKRQPNVKHPPQLPWKLFETSMRVGVSLYWDAMPLEITNTNTRWWFQPIWNILVKLHHFPNFQGENKTYLNPPPRTGLSFFEVGDPELNLS